MAKRKRGQVRNPNFSPGNASSFGYSKYLYFIEMVFFYVPVTFLDSLAFALCIFLASVTPCHPTDKSTESYIHDCYFPANLEVIRVKCLTEKPCNCLRCDVE